MEKDGTKFVNSEQVFVKGGGTDVLNGLFSRPLDKRITAIYHFCNDRNVRLKPKMKGTMKPMLALADSAQAAANIWMYLLYLTISVGLTIWVARTLHKNGRIFLVDSFLGNEPLADSVNHLLVVGFYLINVGFVTLALKYGDKAFDAQTALEILSSKVGVVLVVLGFMHFLNLVIFSKLRRRALNKTQSPLPPPYLPRI